MAGEREVIFEFLRVGAVVKVTAVDTAFGVEASVVGDPAAGDPALKRLALQKLTYALGRRGPARYLTQSSICLTVASISPARG
jgi:hypothetical protein